MLCGFAATFAEHRHSWFCGDVVDFVNDFDWSGFFLNRLEQTFCGLISIVGTDSVDSLAITCNNIYIYIPYDSNMFQRCIFCRGAECSLLTAATASLKKRPNERSDFDAIAGDWVCETDLCFNQNGTVTTLLYIFWYTRSIKLGDWIGEKAQFMKALQIVVFFCNSCT